MMIGRLAKYHARKVGLGEARDTTLTVGADLKVSSSFYRAVVQVVILYASETWVLLVSIAKRIEGMHTEVMRMITGKRAKLLGDGTWETPEVEGIQESAGT